MADGNKKKGLTVDPQKAGDAGKKAHEFDSDEAGRAAENRWEGKAVGADIRGIGPGYPEDADLAEEIQTEEEADGERRMTEDEGQQGQER